MRALQPAAHRSQPREELRERLRLRKRHAIRVFRILVHVHLRGGGGDLGHEISGVARPLLELLHQYAAETNDAPHAPRLA